MVWMFLGHLVLCFLVYCRQPQHDLQADLLVRGQGGGVPDVRDERRERNDAAGVRLCQYIARRDSGLPESLFLIPGLPGQCHPQAL